MITSRDNDTLKLVRKLLAQRRHREETGLFAAEGEDLVDAAHAAGIDPVHLLVAGETVDAALLERVSTLPHPARVIGVYRREDLPSGLHDRCLALWRLTDPGNVGTLLRTADAFCACVALSPGCADPLSPKALRASAGAVFRVPLVRWDELPGRRIALVAHDGAPLDDLELEPPVTFVLGAERAGLPVEQVTDCYKATIALPGAAESLNVAAAGAIALYEASRRRDGDKDSGGSTLSTRMER
ncbi:MAG TPA: RNA methyltransferase [Gaiella sp.]|nr:RNA methyltransferase [Gaiella sp.]